MARLPSEQIALEFPDWQCAYEEALHETDRAKRPVCIKAARVAIFSRLKAKLDRPPGTLERIALNDAIHFLKIIRGTRL